MLNLTPIAHIECDFPTKFGVPRQSGLIPTLHARIIFTPKYRNPDALRGLEGYSHIWLLWMFSENPAHKDGAWSPTVRPPRLGGNTHMGVFATRSPNRPNPIGLSSVKLERIEYHTPDHGAVLHISGADLVNGTPIFDIKPYLPYTDSHPDAVGGFAHEHLENTLRVVYDNACDACLSREERDTLTLILQEDPRPSYQNEKDRIYGMPYQRYDVRFYVEDNIVHVIALQGCDSKEKT